MSLIARYLIAASSIFAALGPGTLRAEPMRSAELGFSPLAVYQSEDSYCSSSVLKTQAFLAGARISSYAVAIRTEKLTQQIQRIVLDAALSASESPVVKARVLKSVLPKLSGTISPAESLEYSQTDEPSRLLLSWNAQYTPEAKLSAAAAKELRRYLIELDLRVLKRAGELAAQQQSSVIDEEIMAKAINETLAAK